jgi:N-acetylglucosaminyldiphosphoundecaprenol N-acetyl-beta-D-mannosaminyltransferase
MRPAADIAGSRAERRSGARLYSRVVVGGVETACVGRLQLADLMAGDCLAARANPRPARLVFAVNGHAVALSALDGDFRRTFEQADIVHADGTPIVAASKWLATTPIPERSATTDFLFDAAATAEAKGLKFYLLGSTERINRACADRLAARNSKLAIAGRRNGYFSPEEEDAVVDAINASGADVLWVGLSVPREYEFCVRNRDRLKVGWIVTCGGCFNFAVGDYVRAPGWMQSAGLEWLHRVWREPKRLFWRYAVTNPVALFLLATRTFAASDVQGQDHAAPEPLRLVHDWKPVPSGHD